MGVVGVDVERAVALLDIVFDALLPGLDQDRRGQRIGCRDQPDFAGFVIAGRDDQPLLVGGQRRADAEALVVFVIELDVAVERLAQPVQPGIVGAPLLVGEAE